VTRTPTPTYPVSVGPIITFFGLASADNHVFPISDVDDLGRPVYAPPSGQGAGFFIVIESKKGTGAAPGTDLSNSSANDPTARPDVQIEASQNLGNGSAAVCDVAVAGPTPMPGGGVPAIDPPNFDSTCQTTPPAQCQMVADALNDLACRLENDSTAPCTKDANDNDNFVNSSTSTQVCTTGTVSTGWGFLSGPTVLTARWRESNGTNIGFPQSIVVRVP